MHWLSLSPYGTGENADVKCRAALCTSISSATFKLLCSLCAPEKLEDCTFVDLKQKLDERFVVKKLVLVERYNIPQQLLHLMPDSTWAHPKRRYF